MANKQQMLHQLLYDTASDVPSSPDTWIHYLTSTSWTYRYTLEEQLLIYAQKPTTKACATFDDWNMKYHRWVNKGSKGIALSNGNKIKYVFDVADTNSPRNQSFNLWSLDKVMQKVHYDYETVVTRIKDYYDEENGEFLRDTINHIVKNHVEDNTIDYLSLLSKYKKDSELEFLEPSEIKTIFNELVHYSVYFQICERFEMQHYDYEYMEMGVFENIRLFNTIDTFMQLSQAVNDGSREIITRVIHEINSVARNYTFDKSKEIKENVFDEERSISNEQNNIQPSGRLSNSQPSSRETNFIREIRNDEEELSQESSTGTLSSIESEERVESTLDDNPGTSESDVRNNHESKNRIDEERNTQQGNESDGMGTSDEYDQERSRGNYSTRDNLQLNLDLGGVEEVTKTIPPFDMQDLPTLLRDEGNLKERVTKEDVIKFYQENINPEDRREFLKENVFKGSFQTFRKRDAYDYSYIGMLSNSHDDNDETVALYSGNYITRESETIVDYDFMQEELGKLIEKDEYLLSPYDKLTTIQRHYHNGNFNSDVDRIMFSQPDMYTMSQAEIIETLSTLQNKEDKIDFVISIFPEGITTFIVDDVPLGMEKKENSLFLFTGSYDNPVSSIVYDWSLVVSEIEDLILSRYFAPDIQIPSVEEQRNAAYHSIEEFQKGNYFSQEEIDAVLVMGSGFVDGKLRIYDALSKDSNLKDDIVFLKKKYGTGAAHPKAGYIGENHNGKGLTLSKGFIGEDDITYTLPWKYVRNRIKTLLSLERYLNTKEEQQYQDFLLQRIKPIASTTTPTNKDTSEVLQETIPKEYQYQLYDMVYIGIKEFEVIEVGKEIVLQDKNFPLFLEQYTKEKLNTLVIENPLNDHLLRPIVDDTVIHEQDTNVLNIDDNKVSTFVESPWKTIYKESLQLLYDYIQSGSYGSVFHDSETTETEAMDIIRESIKEYTSNEMEPLFMGLYFMNNHLQEVVNNELFDSNVVNLVTKYNEDREYQ